MDVSRAPAQPAPPQPLSKGMMSGGSVTIMDRSRIGNGPWVYAVDKQSIKGAGLPAQEASAVVVVRSHCQLAQ